MNTIMSFTIIILLALHMLCKGCYRLSIVLGFSCGQAKTIQIRFMKTPIFFFLKIVEKIPIFENIRIRVDRVSGSKSVVSPQLMVLNSGSRYMISRYSVEEHKDSCCMKFLNPTIIADRLLQQPCLETLGF